VMPPGQQNTMKVWCWSGSMVNRLKGPRKHGDLLGLSCLKKLSRMWTFVSQQSDNCNHIRVKAMRVARTW
jgi:hypothetical protein